MPSSSSSATPSIVAILTHTPVWVWAIFALVLWLGYSRTKDRVLPVWRIVLLPLVILALAIFNLANTGFAPFALLGIAVGASVGIGLGLALRDYGRTENLGGGKLRLKGEWLSLGIVVAIFIVQYIKGVTTAIDPVLAARPESQGTMMAASGLSAGLLLIRTAMRLSVLATPPSHSSSSGQ